VLAVRRRGPRDVAAREGLGVNPHLAHLISDAYDGALAPEHLADLRKSITDETGRLHRIRSVPLASFPALGLTLRKAVRSAYLIPFPAPDGGWMDHVKVRLFTDDGSCAEARGARVAEQRERWRYNRGRQKYDVPRDAAPRLYFPIPSMRDALAGPAPLWIVEGMKKALAVMQLGLPVVGIESAWGWHVKGSRALLPDFASIALRGRLIELVPDSDAQTNPMIARSMRQLADALRAAGARPRLVRVPAAGAKKVGIDDYLMTIPA
jgi:uncharacterized protein DUF3854